MKKIIIVIILTFNLIPYIHHKHIVFGPDLVFAQNPVGECVIEDVVAEDAWDSYTNNLADHGYSITSEGDTHDVDANGQDIIVGTNTTISGNGESYDYYNPDYDQPGFPVGFYYKVIYEPLGTKKDCNDVIGGTAYMSNCGCIGGNTGHTSCDCNNVLDGTAYMADCGCIGGNTGIIDCSADQGSQDCNGDPGGTAYMAECGCIGGNTGVNSCSTTDCNGDAGGTAYWATCGCIGGNTGISGCDPGTGSSDPVTGTGGTGAGTGDKPPTAIDCDAAAIADDNRVNVVYDGMKNNPNFKDMISKATNPGESGMSIVKSSAGYSDLNYVNGTNSTSVPVPTTDPNNTIVAGGHTHPSDKAPSPSAKDIYHLIQGKANNNNYNTDFVFAANGKQFAITITDKTTALAFLNNYPLATSLNGNEWAGSKADRTSLYYQYLTWLATLVSEDYPNDMKEVYGLVYMLATHTSGVKVLQNVNGVFKELNTLVYRDASGKAHIGITICK